MSQSGENKGFHRVLEGLAGIVRPQASMEAELTELGVTIQDVDAAFKPDSLVEETERARGMGLEGNPGVRYIVPLTDGNKGGVYEVRPGAPELAAEDVLFARSARRAVDEWRRSGQVDSTQPVRLLYGRSVLRKMEISEPQTG